MQVTDNYIIGSCIGIVLLQKKCPNPSRYILGNRMLREGDHRDILSLFIGSVKTAQASSRALRTALYNQVLCSHFTSHIAIQEFYRILDTVYSTLYTVNYIYDSVYSKQHTVYSI